jgi:hypothetical protein
MKDDGEWTGGSIPLQFQKRDLVQQFSNDFQHHRNREMRANWQQGFAEPFISEVQEERLEGRIPQPA